tara:strand:+ start:345 stop:476 length:132 start_codon:yes stop_codon:yes gene_type:complete
VVHFLVGFFEFLLGFGGENLSILDGVDKLIIGIVLLYICGLWK